LFIDHDRITRTVTNLSNGIRTVTESADQRIARLLTDHVTSMAQRVETGSGGGYRRYPPEAAAQVPLVRRALAIGFTLL
jgi:hypothetical protein